VRKTSITERSPELNKDPKTIKELLGILCKAKEKDKA
jgi:hypothetical protein